MNFITVGSPSRVEPVVEVNQGPNVSVSLADTDPSAPVVFGIPVEDVRAMMAVASANTPTSNTGCLNTEVIIDWLSLTFLPVAGVSLERVLDTFTPPSASRVDWVALERGAMGYQSCYQRGQVRVYFDGLPGMGIHVSLSGKAVRQVQEEFSLFSEAAWQEWLSLLRGLGCKFTRIDPAMDDVGEEGVLDMGVIREAVSSHSYVSPFAKKNVERLFSERWRAHDGAVVKSEGETFYFGRRSSNMFIRIYNKGAQLGESFHHIRVEPEIKGVNAEEMVTRIIEGGFAEVPKVLRAYLEFKVPGSDPNKSRWEVAPWWDSFLGRCELVGLSVKRVVARSVDDVKAWVKRQASLAFAVVMDSIEKDCRALGLDVRKEQRKYVYGLVEEGRSRYKSKHRLLLGDYSPSLDWGVS